MIFSSLAFIRYSMEPWLSAGQPVFLHAVQQDDVDVVDAELQSVTLEVAPGVGAHWSRVSSSGSRTDRGERLSRPREDRRATRTDRRRRRSRTPWSSAWRTTRVNSLTPSRVWLLAWPLPMLPVPMPTSETWMPVFPSVTSSVGLLGKSRTVPARGPGAPGRRMLSRPRRRSPNGGLSHEITAIEGTCHDVVLPGLEVPINSTIFDVSQPW